MLKRKAGQLPPGQIARTMGSRQVGAGIYSVDTSANKRDRCSAWGAGWGGRGEKEQPARLLVPGGDRLCNASGQG
jgi:hypothetical protein